jgi:hypothetical protein
MFGEMVEDEKGKSIYLDRYSYDALMCAVNCGGQKKVYTCSHFAVDGHF